MKEEFKIFLEKVPVLRSKGKAFMTILYIFGLIGLSIIFFYTFDRISWYMPIITQCFMAIIVSLLGYLHIKRANHFREKYGKLAFQKYLYVYIIPILVTWYGLFFHPLFISGPSIFPILVFPYWVSLLIALILFIMFILVNIHIERAGFSVITHGMDIYTIFPEEATVVRGEIYGFIRHPLYLSLLLGCLSLAFVANNYVALICAALQLIPSIVMSLIEDKELTERENKHLDYINSTSMLFPLRRILGFFKLLFFFK